MAAKDTPQGKPPTVHATAGQPPTPTKDDKGERRDDPSSPSDPKRDDDDIAPFPPEGQEHLDPDTAAAQAAQETKSDQQKFEETAFAQRMATGGQGATGSIEPPNVLGTPPTDTVSGEEVTGSSQPHAPEKPLTIPDLPAESRKK